MIKEEKIELLNRLLEVEEKNDIGNLTRAERREFQQWVEALEQESVLDKIRAEIVDLAKRTMNDNRASGIWACRDIIDKYKAEMEEE